MSAIAHPRSDLAVGFDGLEVGGGGDGLGAVLGGGEEVEAVSAVAAATVFAGDGARDVGEGVHALGELSLVGERDALGEAGEVGGEVKYTK